MLCNLLNRNSFANNRYNLYERLNAHRDYIYCLQRSYDLANYIALNISSPNTEGLRDLASKEYFESLIKEVSNKKNKLIKHHQKDVPVLLKISPDENRDTIENLINALIKFSIVSLFSSGEILSNTGTSF